MLYCQVQREDFVMLMDEILNSFFAPPQNSKAIIINHEAMDR